MRGDPRRDDPGAPRLTVHVLGGRTAVDLGHLRTLLTLLNDAVGAVRAARAAAARARAVVMLCDTLAPLTGPAALAALDGVEVGPVSLAALEGQVEDLRERVGRAIAVYEEAEHTACREVRSWVGPVPGPHPLDLVTRLGWTSAGLWWRVLTGRFAVPHPTGAATTLGPLVNPTGRIVGAVPAAGGTAPVPYLASSLLDVFGLDHVSGTVAVWARDPLTGARHSATISDWTVMTGMTVPIGAATAVPPLRGVPDVVRRLSGAAAASSATGVGRIELVAQERRDGTRAWTVVIPGTRELFFSANPQDHLSNLQLMGGEHSDLLLAAKQALRMAPVEPGDTLVLAGHSQGGIVAAELAADPAVNAQFDVAGVVTLGSPVGQVTGVPADVPVIRMENLDDWIPALDGLANTNNANQLTVQFSAPTHTALFGAHDLRTYGAAYAQAVADGGEVATLDAELRAAAAWNEQDAMARVYTFEFARTDRGREFLEAARHLGLGIR